MQNLIKQTLTFLQCLKNIWIFFLQFQCTELLVLVRKKCDMFLPYLPPLILSISRLLLDCKKTHIWCLFANSDDKRAFSKSQLLIGWAWQNCWSRCCHWESSRINPDQSTSGVTFRNIQQHSAIHNQGQFRFLRCMFIDCGR